MARQLPPFVRPAYAYENALSAPFAKGNRIAEARAIAETLALVEPLIEAVATLKPHGYTGDNSRPIEIPRRLLMQTAIAIRVLGLGPTIGLRTIQTTKELREVLNLDPADAQTIAKLLHARGGQDVVEPGLPSRQMLHSFLTEWLPSYGGIELVDEYVHLTLAYQVCRETGADCSAVTIDSKQAPSPRRHTETDGIMKIGRPQGPIRGGTGGRLAHGVVACKDVPVPLAGALVGLSEPAWAIKVGIPDVARRARLMDEMKKRDGIPSDQFITATSATWTGDGNYFDSNIGLALLDHDGRAAFRIPDSPWREILSEFDASPEGMPGKVVRLQIASGGVCYCPCDRYDRGRELTTLERTAMQQYAGKRGRGGFNYYACEHGSCPDRGIKLKVPYSAILLADGTPNWAQITPTPRADKRVEALNFRGQQVIEQRNMALAELGIARRHPDNTYVLTGAVNNQMAILLTHLVLSARILLNHRAGLLIRTPLEWGALYHSAERKSYRVWLRTPSEKKRKDANGQIRPYPERTGLFYPLAEEIKTAKIASLLSGHGIGAPVPLRKDHELALAHDDEPYLALAADLLELTHRPAKTASAPPTT